MEDGEGIRGGAIGGVVISTFLAMGQRACREPGEVQNAIGLKWPKEPAEDTLVGPRYPESESGEPLINAFKSMDSTDEAVLDSGRFLVILADGRGL